VGAWKSGGLEITHLSQRPLQFSPGAQAVERKALQLGIAVNRMERAMADRVRGPSAAAFRHRVVPLHSAAGRAVTEPARRRGEVGCQFTGNQQAPTMFTIA